MRRRKCGQSPAKRNHCTIEWSLLADENNFCGKNNILTVLWSPLVKFLWQTIFQSCFPCLLLAGQASKDVSKSFGLSRICFPLEMFSVKLENCWNDLKAWSLSYEKMLTCQLNGQAGTQTANDSMEMSSFSRFT